MKRIGEIAARLVANPIELVAAANQKRSTKFGDGTPVRGDVPPMPPVSGNEIGPTTLGGSERVGPTRDAHARADRDTNEGKGPGRTPASFTGPRQKGGEFERPSNRRRIAPELKLIATSDARGHPHANNSEFPARSPRVSLVVVGGREYHAASPSGLL